MRRKVLSALTAGIVTTVSFGPAWAESASPTGDPAGFLAGTGVFDDNAGGTKYAAALSLVYDKETRPAECAKAPNQQFIRNVYFSLTLDQGTLLAPFTTDYLNGVLPHGSGFCMLDNDLEQARVIVELIRTRAIPFIYTCDPATTGSCPGFKIKAIRNFVYTAGPLSTPTSGGVSAEITIAVD